MRNLRSEIESLHHLTAFEAAARLGSFTRAATELNVSQPAISQSVRRLEEVIGVKLFRRGHRNIELTDAGELLNYDVSEGFKRIQSTVQHLRRLNRSRHVTLSVSTAFANYWMVPRLQEFHRAHPAIDLRLQTTDKDLDLAQEGISLGIRRGAGNWPGYHCALIAPEVQIAVAAPRWVEASPPILSLADLKTRALIHLEEPYRERPAWSDWFSGQGVSFRDTGDGLRLNDYALVLQAAMAGEGIALGWTHVCKTLIDQGLLAQIGTWRWSSTAGFYLLWSRKTPLSDHAEATREWMLAEARKTRTT